MRAGTSLQVDVDVLLAREAQQFLDAFLAPGGGLLIAAERRAEVKPLRQQLARAEAEIVRLTKEIEQLDVALADGSLFARDAAKAAILAKQRADAAAALAQAEEDWLSVGAALQSAMAAAGVRWIGLPDDRPSTGPMPAERFYRRRFDLPPGPIRRATFTLTAADQFILRVNGATTGGARDWRAGASPRASGP